MNIEQTKEVMALLAELAEFRRSTGAIVAEWEKKKGSKNDGNELVIELSAVLAEADNLSRLINSIVDGTEEDVPIEELKGRFMRVLAKVGNLKGRWKALCTKGIER